jgi:hypothetical protein
MSSRVVDEHPGFGIIFEEHEYLQAKLKHSCDDLSYIRVGMKTGPSPNRVRF